MFYFDRNQYQIVEISEGDVIKLFGKPEVEFQRMSVRNPNMFVYSSEKYDDGYSIFEADGYDRLKIIASGLSEELAEHLTNLKNAISAAANDSNGCTFIFETRTEVIDLIRNELEDKGCWDLEDEWDVEIRAKLNQVLEDNEL